MILYCVEKLLQRKETIATEDYEDVCKIDLGVPLVSEQGLIYPEALAALPVCIMFCVQEKSPSIVGHF